MKRILLISMSVLAFNQAQAAYKPQEWISPIHNFECGLLAQIPKDTDENPITRARIHINVDEGTGVFKSAKVIMVTKFGDVRDHLGIFNLARMEKPDNADSFYWLGQVKAEPDLVVEGRFFVETKGKYKDRIMYAERLSGKKGPIAYALYGCHAEDGD